MKSHLLHEMKVPLQCGETSKQRRCVCLSPCSCGTLMSEVDLGPMNLGNPSGLGRPEVDLGPVNPGNPSGLGVPASQPSPHNLVSIDPDYPIAHIASLRSWCQSFNLPICSSQPHALGSGNTSLCQLLHPLLHGLPILFLVGGEFAFLRLCWRLAS